MRWKSNQDIAPTINLECPNSLKSVWLRRPVQYRQPQGPVRMSVGPPSNLYQGELTYTYENLRPIPESA